jgi:hypothetical protein
VVGLFGLPSIAECLRFEDNLIERHMPLVKRTWVAQYFHWPAVVAREPILAFNSCVVSLGDLHKFILSHFG